MVTNTVAVDPPIAVTAGEATISVEPVTDEHRAWLACRQHTMALGEYAIVRRREGFIAHVFPAVGTCAWLCDQAQGYALIWCARYVEVGA